MNQKYDFWDYLCIAALVTGGYFLFIHGIGSYGLWDPWEPKYGQAIREMIARGDLITPYFDGAIRWTKPILIYWALLPSVLLFGNNEFALRLPSALVALLGVLIIFHAIRSLKGRREGMIAACVLATLPQYAMLARQVTPDIYLTVFLGSAMCFFALARFGKVHNKIYYWLFYASFSLAFLAKGLPVGVAAAAFLIFWSVNLNHRYFRRPILLWGQLLRMFRRYRVLDGIIILLVIAGPWCAAMFLKHHFTFYDKFIGEQNIGRFQKIVTGHKGGTDFYFRTLIYGMYPWIAIIPAAILFLAQGKRRNNEQFKRDWYFMSWFIAAFVLFTCSATKFHHYLAPITPSLAVLVAIFWGNYLKRSRNSFYINSGILLSIIFTWLPTFDFLKLNQSLMMLGFTVKNYIFKYRMDYMLLAFFSLWVFVLLLALVVRRSRIIAALLVIVAFSYTFHFSQTVLPLQSKYKTLKNYAELFEKTKQKGDVLILFGKKKYSLNYYTDNSYTFFGSWAHEGLLKYLKKHPRAYLIARKSKLKWDSPLRRWLKFKTKKKWFLIDKEHPDFCFLTNVDIRQDFQKQARPIPFEKIKNFHPYIHVIK